MSNITCPNCKTLLNLGEFSGHPKVRCPQCAQIVEVPQPAPALPVRPMIRFKCPTCQNVLQVSEEQAGQKLPCPGCAQRLLVPPPAHSRNKTVLGESMPGGDKTILGEPVGEVVPLELDDDGRDYRPRRRRRRRDERDRDDDYGTEPRKRRRGPFECPECGSREPPELRKETAQAGWIIFIVLLLFFFPLCWLGIFMRETWEVCWECGHKCRKVDEMSLKF